jgi:hypothetical protein
MDSALAANPKADVSKISPDHTKEVTACNTCHDDGQGNAYNYKLRSVPPATVYFNYSGKNGTKISRAIRNFAATFPDSGNSNMCVLCHSGRLVGLDVKMADIRNIDLSNISRLTDHFRGAAQLVFANDIVDASGRRLPTGFEFYTSSAKYYNPTFSHNIIGLNKSNVIAPDLVFGPFAGDKRNTQRGNGPCIGCHQNADGSDGTSHTFLPVNREASSTFLNTTPPDGSREITKITSKACADCHAGPYAWNPDKLQQEKVRYRAALDAFRVLLSFALHTNSNPNVRENDNEGRPTTPVNWLIGNDVTLNNIMYPDRLQSWLVTGRSSVVDPLHPADFDFYDPMLKSYGRPTFASYTMGAVYNFFMFYYDPGAFAHNSSYTKRLIYDSMDWLDNGKLDGSVSTLFCTNVFWQTDTTGAVLSYTCNDAAGSEGRPLFGANSEQFRIPAKTSSWRTAFEYLMFETAGQRP